VAATVERNQKEQMKSEPLNVAGAPAVGCSDLLANQPPPRRGNDTRNWLALICIRCVAKGSAGGGK
jgi:hypothetical protein